MTPSILEIMNFIGIISFTISGTSKGVSKGLDLFGTIVLGIVTSYAGGVTADILLGILPPTILRQWQFLLLSISVSSLTFFYYRYLDRRFLREVLKVSDAIGLSAFAVYGASLAYSYDLNIIAVALISSIVASGGGALRDVLVNDVPLILTKEIYATAAMTGGIVYYIVAFFTNVDLATLTSIITVMTIRGIAIKYNLSLPSIKV
ncbi:trimeric intracellular cation channel family protein [Sulfuracidifex metallicus DSM 6482 = JCM 9184]|nr:trimeric intracellular cation channel family protein [Sulfuracidifex metallicus DSM 6482 = JCM 9184]